MTLTKKLLIAIVNDTKQDFCITAIASCFLHLAKIRKEDLTDTQIRNLTNRIRKAANKLPYERAKVGYKIIYKYNFIQLKEEYISVELLRRSITDPARSRL